MITLTESAKTQLERYFADKERSDIRVFVASGGCSGAQLSLALDDAGEGDQRYEADGFGFVVDNELAEAAGGLTIDMNYYGFSVTSANDLGLGGACNPGGCSTGGGCSCGGCGH